MSREVVLYVGKKHRMRLAFGSWILMLLLCTAGVSFAQEASGARTAVEADAGSYPVMDAGVYSLRSWKVAKGAFEEMLRIHQAGVMPFYERLGVRYLGFWTEVPGPDHPVDPDHDNVYMLTHYDSIEHWQRTRAPWAWGAPDEEFLRMAVAIAERGEHVIEEHHQFLSGHTGARPPSLLRRKAGSGTIGPAEFRRACEAAVSWSDAPTAYCRCVDDRIGEAPSSWGRPMLLAWLRAGGRDRPDLTSRLINDVHAACVSTR